MVKNSINNIKKEFEDRGYLLLSDTYVNCTTKLKYICLTHQEKGIQEIDYSHFKRGQGCLSCKGINRHTYEEVKQNFEKAGYVLVSKEYSSSQKKLEYICPFHKDKGILKTTYANFLKGKRCPYCSKRVKRTPEEYETELNKIFSTIIPLEPYNGLKVKIFHRCLVCGEEWKVVPTNLLHLKQGCPRCGKHHKRTQEEFIEDVYKVNPDIEVIGDFTKVADKIKFKCKNCGNVWEAKPNNILNGKGCPVCKTSKGEKRVKNFLEANNIDYISQKTFDDCYFQNLLKFDFYLPKYNVCIEYDGIQHFIPQKFHNMSDEECLEKFNELKKRDNIKNEYCIKNNILLLRIPYWEYNNIEEIISTFLGQI